MNLGLSLKFKDAATKRYISIKKAIAENIAVVKVLSFIDRKTGKRTERIGGKPRTYTKVPHLAKNFTVKLRGEKGRFVSSKKRHLHESVRPEVWSGDFQVYVGQYELVDTLREQKMIMNISLDKAITFYLPLERSWKGGVGVDTLEVAEAAYKASPSSAKSFYVWQLIFSKTRNIEKTQKIYKESKDKLMEMDIKELKEFSKGLK